jgi:hypothetical protein
MTAPKPRVVGLNAPELGRLPDGTPYFAPLGEIPYDRDEDKVQCHLCGDWFRFVGASHVRWHGWTLDEYREAFQLLKRTSTAAAGVSDKLRRNAIARKETNERWANPPRATTPRLTGRGVPRWRSLAALRPDLAAQLHPTRSGDLDPYQLGLGSTRRVWWRCGSCGYEWRAAILHRVSTGAGCRRCTSPAWRVPRERSLAVLRPDLAAELHPTRNGELDPYQLGAGSQRRPWWRCGTCGHEWRTAVRGRSREGYGCPRCARERRAVAQRRVPCERSLAVLRPDLAAELHPTHNGELDPYRVAPMSRRSVWWRCGACGHEWRTLLTTRARGHGCPECHRRASIGRRRPVPRERSLAVLRPDLAAELHPSRNGDLDAFTVARWSVQPVWWQCGTCGHEWRVTPQNRRGCPRCSARRPVPRERSLAVLRPDLATELHPTRNGDLDPYALGAGANQKVWWRCRYCGRDWQARVAGRSHSPGGCASCAKRRGALKRSRGQVAEPSTPVSD